MGDEETPESPPDLDEALPRFNRSYYSVGRGYAYTRTEGSNYPTDHIGGDRIQGQDTYRQPKGLKVFDAKDEYTNFDNLFRF